MSRAPKSYDQQCPLAFALDRIGDRWTILIIRELLGGPAKFGELSRALPGAASNLLTERLRRLADHGIVRRDGDRSAPLYRLTPLGEELRPALEALGLWGAVAGPIPGSTPAAVTTVRSVAMGLQTMLSLGDRPDHPWRVEIVVGDDLLDVEVGTPADPPRVVCRPASTPDAQVTMTLAALNDLAFLTEVPEHDDVLAHEAGDRRASDALVAAIVSAVERKLAS